MNPALKTDILTAPPSAAEQSLAQTTDVEGLEQLRDRCLHFNLPQRAALIQRRIDRLMCT